jgi:hypothetical protein
MKNTKTTRQISLFLMICSLKMLIIPINCRKQNAICSAEAHLLDKKNRMVICLDSKLEPIAD